MVLCSSFDFLVEVFSSKPTAAYDKIRAIVGAEKAKEMLEALGGGAPKTEEPAAKAKAKAKAKRSRGRRRRKSSDEKPLSQEEDGWK